MYCMRYAKLILFWRACPHLLLLLCVNLISSRKHPQRNYHQLQYYKHLTPIVIITYTKYTCEPYRFSYDHGDKCTIYTYCFTSKCIQLTRKTVRSVGRRSEKSVRQSHAPRLLTVRCIIHYFAFYRHGRLKYVLLYFFLSRFEVANISYFESIILKATPL